jgi:hypothetical protein
MIAGHEKGLHGGERHWGMKHCSIGVNVGHGHTCLRPPLIDRYRR